MKSKKIYLICCILVVTFLASATNTKTQTPPQSQPAIFERAKDYLKKRFPPTNTDSDDDEQDILLHRRNLEIQQLRTELSQTQKEVQQLRTELSQTQKKVQRLRDAQIALYYNLPSYRLSQEQLQISRDLLADEPGILKIIQKYHDFIKSLERKKLIALPED